MRLSNNPTNQIKVKSKFRIAVGRQIPGYFFMLPAFLFIFIYMTYPLLYSLVLSFTEYNFAFDEKPVFCGFQIPIFWTP